MTTDRSRLRTLLFLLATSAAASVLSACHTGQGVGQDISAMGSTGQRWIDGADANNKK